MNKQHVFDKFDIIRDFYNGKNTFTRLAMGNREKICCFNNSRSQIIHVSPIHEININSNTNYHIITFILLNIFLFNVDLGKTKMLT